MQSISLYIGFRYIRKQFSSCFNCFMFLYSSFIIMICVVTLIIITSIINGFNHKIKKNILNFIPHVLITTKDGYLNPKEIPQSVLKDTQGIVNISSITTDEVILNSSHAMGVGKIIGIDLNDKNSLSIYSLEKDKIELLYSRKYCLILGEKLSIYLNVKTGDKLNIIFPQINNLTPVGFFPRQKIFNIVGVFKTNTEVDEYQIITNQQDASRLMNYPPGHFTGWRLWLKDALYMYSLNFKYLSDKLILKDWREEKGELFKVIHTENNIMIFLIILVIIVSVFNIICSIELLIIRKMSEIAILEILGMNRKNIMLIFIIQGLTFSTVGVILGVILGILITNKLNSLLIFFKILDKRTILPILINHFTIVKIALYTIIISFLSFIYPSWNASKICLSKALRNE